MDIQLMDHPEAINIGMVRRTVMVHGNQMKLSCPQMVFLVSMMYRMTSIHIITIQKLHFTSPTPPTTPTIA